MTNTPTATPPPAPTPTAAPAVTIPQWSLGRILGVWAAAAVPMAVLAWVVAPRLADHLEGPAPLAQALLVCLTAGLVWQFVLVAALVRAEQGTLRWSVVKPALWLERPVSPRTGRAGGRVWWVVLPLVVGFGLEELVPAVTHPDSHDFGVFMGSHGAEALLHGSWGWFALVATMVTFNTVLGEELLFRGLLLPRMNGVFGRGDWAANGVLFACYHLHMWWAIPGALFDALFLAWPSKRYRSAWIGIAVHSAQSVFILLGVLALVL